MPNQNTAAEIAVNAQLGIDPETVDALKDEAAEAVVITPELVKLGELLDKIDGAEDGALGDLPIAEILGDIDSGGDLTHGAIRSYLVERYGEEKLQAAFDEAFGQERNHNEVNLGNMGEDGDLMSLLMALSAMMSDEDEGDEDGGDEEIDLDEMFG